MKPHCHRLAGVALLCAVLGGVPAAGGAAAETTPSRAGEYWIASARPNAKGDGTREHPFDGSTRDAFDAVMRGLPEHATLHLLPGTYETLGSGHLRPNWRLKSGQRLLGGGRDVTVLRLARDAEPQNSVIGSAPAGGDDIEVADLTVDCGYTPDRTNALLNGVTLYGSRNAVRRINVVNGANCGSDPRYAEAYGILIGTDTRHNSQGVTVEDCRVSRFTPPKFNAQGVAGIALVAAPRAWISGILRSNVVDFSEANNPVGNGLSGAWMRDSVIERNEVKGAVAGFYGEQGSDVNVSFALNYFENCEVGIFITHDPRRNLTIRNNTFAYTKPFFDAAVLRFDDEAAYTNIVFTGNSVTSKRVPSRGGVMLLAVHNIRGLVVAHNRVDCNVENVISHCTDVRLFNNLDGHGVPLVGLGPADPNSISLVPTTGREGDR